MRTVFEPASPIDESNFLKYDIRYLKTVNSSTSYRDAIDGLVAIRETLLVLESIGRLLEVANRNAYIEALRWLKGETPLQSWHYVPHTPDLSIMPVETADAFRSYVQQLSASLQAEVLYSQVEIAVRVAPMAKSMPVTKRVEQSLESAKDQLDEVASQRIVTIQNTANDFDMRVQSVIEGARTTAESNLQSSINDAYTQIDQRVQNAMSQVQQATALRDWGTVYDLNISELSQKLYGASLEGTLNRNFRSLMAKLKNLSLMNRKDINWRRLTLKVLYIIGKNTWSLTRAVLSKLMSVAGRHTVSFILLATGALLMVAMPLLEAAGMTHMNLFNPSSPTQWLTKVAIWLPLIVILSVAYSFSTNNYRIYSNMLDQYKHRRAVARTAQGIIFSIDSSAEDKDIRNAMTASAAAALFEHKVTGHLSKKEVESLGLLDIIRTAGGK